MINHTHQKLASVLFLTAAGILLIAAAGKFTNGTFIRNSVDETKSEQTVSDSKKELDKLIADLTKENMVCPPIKPSPPSQVDGILGDKAYFNGRAYKLGDKVPPGAVIKEIACTYVTITFEGKDIKLYPINAPCIQSVTKKVEAPKTNRKAAAKKEVVKQAQTAPTSAPAGDDLDSLDWLDIPEHLKAMVRQMWDQLTPEQKKQAKEKWQSMSQEEKDKAIEQMEKQYQRMNG